MAAKISDVIFLRAPYCVLEFMQSVLAFRFLEHKRNVVRFEDVVFAEEE